MSAHILVAEDDLHIRQGLQELLEGEGYRVTTAADGQQALNAYTAEKPALLLLDIMMPKKSGYDVCREVRAIDALTPVIFVSARSEEIDRVLGLELGADDYIMKPFGLREVLARVKAALRRSQLSSGSGGESQSNETCWKMDDLTIYADSLRAERGSAAIDLSQRDVAILRLLHQRCGKVVSRDELYDSAWGRSYLPSSRSLDQHMSQLRRRIEQDPAQPRIIQTVYGVGYRFDANEIP